MLRIVKDTAANFLKLSHADAKLFNKADIKLDSKSCQKFANDTKVALEEHRDKMSPPNRDNMSRLAKSHHPIRPSDPPATYCPGTIYVLGHNVSGQNVSCLL